MTISSLQGASTHIHRATMSRGQQPGPQNILFDDSMDTENPATASLEGFDESNYSNLKQSWLTGLSQRSEIIPTDLVALQSVNIENLLSTVRSKIRFRVFNDLPSRVLKLPEMKLVERGSVVEYLIHHKLHDVVEEIRYREAAQLSGSSVPPTTLDRDRLRDHAISTLVDDLTKFATLSHAWEQHEPSYEDFLQGRNVNTKGYKKLKEFCRIAYEKYGVEFAWADTVCINKLSSSELDESIRSMFTWYRASFICIIYVSGTHSLLELPFDRWFTRGWTLQELLAPLRIKFYNKDWHQLTDLRNDKLDRPENHSSTQLSSLDPKYALQLRLLSDGISTATGIDMDYIRSFQPGLRDPPFPERMKWIARRETTRAEDKSYSMMGVLGVSMSVAYGEGPERAFFRLMREVLEMDYSDSWFLWTGKPIPSHIHPSNMIPSSPAGYLSWDPKFDRDAGLDEREPLSLTNIGMEIQVLVILAKVVHPLLASSTSDEADVTSPFFDGTMKMADIPREQENQEDAFALGIMDYDFVGQVPEWVYALLLRRPRTRARWMRCEARDIIAFRPNAAFRQRAVKGWARVETPAKGNAIHMMRVQTLYL